jgi:hypothetical protein
MAVYLVDHDGREPYGVDDLAILDGGEAVGALGGIEAGL